MRDAHDNDGESRRSGINVTEALTVSSDDFFYNIGAMFWDDCTATRSRYGETPSRTVAAQSATAR